MSPFLGLYGYVISKKQKQKTKIRFAQYSHLSGDAEAIFHDVGVDTDTHAHKKGCTIFLMLLVLQLIFFFFFFKLSGGRKKN